MKDSITTELNRFGLWITVLEGYMPTDVDLETSLKTKPVATTSTVKDYEIKLDPNNRLYLSVSNYRKTGKAIRNNYKPIDVNGLYKGTFIFSIGREKETVNKNLERIVKQIKVSKRFKSYKKQEEVTALTSMAYQHLLVYSKELNSPVYSN